MVRSSEKWSQTHTSVSTYAGAAVHYQKPADGTRVDTNKQTNKHTGSREREIFTKSLEAKQPANQKSTTLVSLSALTAKERKKNTSSEF